MNNWCLFVCYCSFSLLSLFIMLCNLLQLLTALRNQGCHFCSCICLSHERSHHFQTATTAHFLDWMLRSHQICGGIFCLWMTSSCSFSRSWSSDRTWIIHAITAVHVCIWSFVKACVSYIHMHVFVLTTDNEPRMTYGRVVMMTFPSFNDHSCEDIFLDMLLNSCTYISSCCV